MHIKKERVVLYTFFQLFTLNYFVAGDT